MEQKQFAIIGAGLAGCECALVLAAHGYNVTIFEQKPLYRSEAHASNLLAELVCSNSFRSNEISRGIGLLKQEMRQLGSEFMKSADRHQIPAGKALAVDREAFARDITDKISSHPQIRLVNKRMDNLGEDILRESGSLGIILAAGPMLADSLADSLARLTGMDNCYFYDAIAPVVWSDTLDMTKVFRSSRFNETEEGDYYNCPFNKAEYEAFHEALCDGKKFQPHQSEKEIHFEGCMPIEALAERGPRTLAYGPLKPVGLVDPNTGHRPWAVLQLRPEKANYETCNLVGCQTKLLQGEQERIFRMVPGLEKAEFARFGSMHRNTYVNAPKVLNQDLSLRNFPDIFLAGQLTGVEGYVESAACGLWLGLSLAMKHKGKVLAAPPEQTALGSLLAHLQRAAKNFQPANANFGLMPPLEEKVSKKDRREAYARRGESYFRDWIENCGLGN